MISQAITRFLAEQVASIERLDVLLLMHRHRERWCAADALSVELRMPVDHAERHLERLCAINLLEVKIADTVLYRYQPGTAWLAACVDEIARAHFAGRDSVLSQVTASTPGATLFADAFRFRKGPRDG